MCFRVLPPISLSFHRWISKVQLVRWYHLDSALAIWGVLLDLSYLLQTGSCLHNHHLEWVPIWACCRVDLCWSYWNHEASNILDLQRNKDQTFCLNFKLELVFHKLCSVRQRFSRNQYPGKVNCSLLIQLQESTTLSTAITCFHKLKLKGSSPWPWPLTPYTLTSYTVVLWFCLCYGLVEECSHNF